MSTRFNVPAVVGVSKGGLLKYTLEKVSFNVTNGSHESEAASGP